MKCSEAVSGMVHLRRPKFAGLDAGFEPRRPDHVHLRE